MLSAVLVVGILRVEAFCSQGTCSLVSQHIVKIIFVVTFLLSCDYISHEQMMSNGTGPLDKFVTVPEFDRHSGLVCLLYVPSQQLWSWRDGQFT